MPDKMCSTELDVMRRVVVLDYAHWRVIIVLVEVKECCDRHSLAKMLIIARMKVLIVLVVRSRVGVRNRRNADRFVSYCFVVA